MTEAILFIISQNVYPDGLLLDDIAFITEAINEGMRRWIKWRIHISLSNMFGLRSDITEKTRSC